MATVDDKDAELQKKLTFSKVFSICDSFVDPGAVYGGTIVRWKDKQGRPILSHEFLLKKVNINPPYLQARYYENNDSDPFFSNLFAIEYNDRGIVGRLEANEMGDPFNVLRQEVSKVLCSPAKEIVITVDEKDTIRLNQNVGSGNKYATFPIGQEDFLKCCNANHLKFEVFKGDDDEPITEFFSNEKDEILMIEQCRALYNYVVDDKMFPEALPKLLRRQKTESRRDVIRDVAIIGKVTIIFVLIVLFFLWAIKH